MKKHLFIFFGSLMLLGCQNIERSEKPENLIPEDKMVEVLTEVSLLNSARNFNKRLFESTGINPEEYIYEKFDIDSLQFQRSNNFYAENYQDYDQIYNRVKKNLDGMKAKLDSLQEETRRKRDLENDSLVATSKETDSLQVDSLQTDTLKIEKIPFLDSIGNPVMIEVPETQF